MFCKQLRYHISNLRPDADSQCFNCEFVTKTSYKNIWLSEESRMTDPMVSLAFIKFTDLKFKTLMFCIIYSKFDSNHSKSNKLKLQVEKQNAILRGSFSNTF